MGPKPKCKHLSVVLLGLMSHSKTKTMVLEQSCTSKLQSFHRPNKFYGRSPVKCKDFPLPRSMKNLIYDPEPEDCKQTPEQYKSLVQNSAMNYAASTGRRNPLLQLIQPAHIFASVSEPTYSKTNIEREVLRRLNVSAISKQEIKKLRRPHVASIRPRDGHMREKNFKAHSFTE